MAEKAEEVDAHAEEGLPAKPPMEEVALPPYTKPAQSGAEAKFQVILF